MKKISQGVGRRTLILLLTLTIILSSLASCVYTPATKDEISSNIQNSTSDKSPARSSVAEYLIDWEMPRFDTVKFAYFETCLDQVYNYEGGMPDKLTHASETAKLFIENYYDQIDHSDKTAVTDALLDCLVNVLADPYAIYRPPVETDEYETDMSGKFGGIGVLVEYDHENETIMVNTVYPGSPGEAAGVKAGDYFYAIDGVTVEEIGYLNAVDLVRGEIGSPVEITFIRGEEFVTVTAIRAEVEEILVDYTVDYEENLGYVRIVSFKENTINQFVKAIDELEKQNVRGIVFDLRTNPGGYVQSVCDVISYLIPSGKTIVSYQYKGRENVVRKSTDDAFGVDHVVDLPFVVICDEYTASSGEIFTSAIRDYRDEGMLRATIVGTTTYKKGIMQNTYYYLDDSTVTVTVAYYNPPCGVNYHGIGITPDVIVENTAEEDLQLKTAYAELIKLINAN